VDIDEIIREVENGSRVTSPRSNDIYENTTTTQPPSSTPTTSSAPTLLYSDDILSRTAITIQPWDMIVISNDTIHEITQNMNTPSSMSLNGTLPYTSFEPITIQIIVQCGELGTIQDNCIIHGGDTHFVIDVTLLQQPYHKYYYYNSTTAHHPSLFLPLFNIQTTIEFRGITMQSAKDTSILLYHSSGYIILANTNNSFNHTILYNTLLPTLHQVTILFQDCYWEQNYGNYGAVLNVYKEEEDVMSYPTNTHSDDTNDDDAIVVALYQLSVKFRRCIFENNFSKEGSAILIENTDWTNTLITVVESLFLNSAQSGAIRATYTSNNNTYISTTTTTTKKNESAVFKPQEIILSPHEDFNVGLIMMDSCFIGNINSISQGTIFVEYPHYQRGNIVVTNNNNYGQNNMVGTIEIYDNNNNNNNNNNETHSYHPSCSTLFIRTIPWTNEDNNITYQKEQCMEFDATTEIESCQLLQNVPVEVSLAPTQTPSNLNILCSDGTTIGYSSWIPLTNAIENSLGNEIFILCPNTGTFACLDLVCQHFLPFADFNFLCFVNLLNNMYFFNLSQVFNPQEFLADGSQILPFTVIQITDKSNITVQCGSTGSSDHNCTIRTGESHFWLQGKVTLIKFLGITFQQALQTSILAYASYGSDASFIDCSWDDNGGDYGAAINIWHELDPIRMEINLYNCVFSNNTSNATVIYNEGGSLFVDNCKFYGNNYGAVLVKLGGMVSVTYSCFEENAFFYPAIYIDEDSSLYFEAGNYGRDNSLSLSNENCTDILWEDVGCYLFESTYCANAIPISAPTASPAPSLSPRPTSSICYSNWVDLSSAIKSNNVQPEGASYTATYQICSDTVLVVQDSDPELLVTRSNTHIFCNNCTISGGQVHVVIKLSPKNVRFHGITFSGAKQGSVIAAGRKDANALFRSCIFDSNRGFTIITTSYQYAPHSMSLTFDSCVFSNSRANTALIQNLGGKVMISDCIISNNNAGNMISVAQFGSLSLERSCFMENSSINYGTIRLSDGSKLIFNLNNFGENNTVAFSIAPCDIFVGTNDSCLKFGASQCLSSIEMS